MKVPKARKAQGASEDVELHATPVARERCPISEDKLTIINSHHIRARHARGVIAYLSYENPIYTNCSCVLHQGRSMALLEAQTTRNSFAIVIVITDPHSHVLSKILATLLAVKMYVARATIETTPRFTLARSPRFIDLVDQFRFTFTYDINNNNR